MLYEGDFNIELDRVVERHEIIGKEGNIFNPETNVLTASYFCHTIFNINNIPDNVTEVIIADRHLIIKYGDHTDVHEISNINIVDCVCKSYEIIDFYKFYMLDVNIFIATRRDSIVQILDGTLQIKEYDSKNIFSMDSYRCKTASLKDFNNCKRYLGTGLYNIYGTYASNIIGGVRCGDHVYVPLYVGLNGKIKMFNGCRYKIVEHFYIILLGGLNNQLIIYNMKEDKLFSKHVFREQLYLDIIALKIIDIVVRKTSPEIYTDGGGYYICQQGSLCILEEGQTTGPVYGSNTKSARNV